MDRIFKGAHGSCYHCYVLRLACKTLAIITVLANAAILLVVVLTCALSFVAGLLLGGLEGYGRVILVEAVESCVPCFAFTLAWGYLCGRLKWSMSIVAALLTLIFIILELNGGFDFFSALLN